MKCAISTLNRKFVNPEIKITQRTLFWCLKFENKRRFTTCCTFVSALVIIIQLQLSIIPTHVLENWIHLYGKESGLGVLLLEKVFVMCLSVVAKFVEART